MSVPNEFENDHKLYLQAMDGGAAMGHPDVSMALFFDDKGQVHFFEYAHSKGTSQPAEWNKGQSSAASFVKKPSLYG